MRAVNIAFDIPYEEAYKVLADAGRKPKKGFVTHNLLGKNGFSLNGYKVEWSLFDKNPTLRAFLEAHPVGRFVLTIRKHAFAVIDGKVHDLFIKPKAKIINVFELKKSIDD